MDELLQIAGQYGALGLMLIASFWYINKKDKDHQLEIDKMEERFKQQHVEALGITKSNTIALETLALTIEKNMRK